MLHLGTQLYGKVDQVPGLFYVATKFFHVSFLPLFPLGSHVIFEGTEKDGRFQGVPIPLNGRSVLFAWIRAVLFIAGGVATAFTLLFGLISVIDKRFSAAVLGVAAAATLLFFFLKRSYAWSRANPIRALELAALAGVSPEELAGHFADRLTPEDEQALAPLRQSPNAFGERLSEPHVSG